MMEAIVNDRVAYFLIAHTAPHFCFPGYFNLIKTAVFDVNHHGKSFSVPKLLNQDSRFRPTDSYLADYAIPTIRKLLAKNSEDIDFVSIALHRKFISKLRVGRPAINYPGMCIAPSHSVTEELLRFDKQSNCLIMQPLQFNFGVDHQYERAHVKTDFDELLRLAIDSKVLSAVEETSFRSSTVLFPGLPVGVIPKDLFFRLAELYEQYVLYTDQVGFRCFKPEDPYQRRARSFFLERLCSYWFRVMTGSSLFDKHSTYDDQCLLGDSDFGFCVTIDNLDPASGVYRIETGDNFLGKFEVKA